MFTAYLALLILQAYHPLRHFNREHVNCALDFARQVNDPYLYHKTYQAVALICAQLGEFSIALDCAQLAFAYFETQVDTRAPLEQALSAYAVANALHGLGRLDDALTWLETAAELFARVDYPLQNGIIARQKGLLYIQQQMCEPALQWLEMALREFTTRKAPFHIALTHHYLGMAYACQEQWSKSEDHLRQAIKLWNHNISQRVYTERTLALVEARSGYPEGALERLKALQREQLPNTPFNRSVIADIARLVTALESGSGSVYETYAGVAAFTN
ncbi:MAG: hypothetical protein OHK0046_19710 [Anaerolineae bacterium]